MVFVAQLGRQHDLYLLVVIRWCIMMKYRSRGTGRENWPAWLPIQTLKIRINNGVWKMFTCSENWATPMKIIKELGIQEAAHKTLKNCKRVSSSKAVHKLWPLTPVAFHTNTTCRISLIVSSCSHCVFQSGVSWRSYLQGNGVLIIRVPDLNVAGNVPSLQIVKGVFLRETFWTIAYIFNICIRHNFCQSPDRMSPPCLSGILQKKWQSI